jgi:hypothetical protein
LLACLLVVPDHPRPCEAPHTVAARPRDLPAAVWLAIWTYAHRKKLFRCPFVCLGAQNASADVSSVQAPDDISSAASFVLHLTSSLSLIFILQTSSMRVSTLKLPFTKVYDCVPSFRAVGLWTTQVFEGRIPDVVHDNEKIILEYWAESLQASTTKSN